MKLPILAVSVIIGVIAAAGDATAASVAPSCPATQRTPADVAALRVLRQPAFAPSEIGLFTPEAYAAAAALTPADPAGAGQTTREGVRAKLSELLTSRFQGDARQARAALAVFDSARAQGVVPDSRLRAGLALLAGTAGESAVAAVRRGLVGRIGFGPESAPAGADAEAGIVLPDRYAHEDPQLLAPLVAQAVLGREAGGGIEGAGAIGRALAALVYAQLLDATPALATSGTALARELNTDLLRRVNGRDEAGGLRLTTATSPLQPGGRA